MSPSSLVHELFENQARSRPGATAIEYEGAHWSYAELDGLSSRLARRLRARGAGFESIVAVCLDRSPAAVVALLGVLKAGGAYCPLDPSDPESRRRIILRDTNPVVVLTEPRLRDRFAATDPLLLLDDSDAEEREADDRPADPLALAYVMYTSGSTGTPKGVCVTHRGITRLVRQPGYVALGPDEVILHAAPITFDASTFEIWGALLHGARLVVVPRDQTSLEGIGEAVQRGRVTTLFLTSALFNQVIDENLQALRGVRQLITGGDVVSTRHIRKALRAHPSLRLIHAYGPTECTTFATTYPCPDASEIGDTVPIGWPIAETTVHLLDEALTPVGDGAEGEIVIGGHGVARGYLNRPEATAAAFIPDRFTATPGAMLYRTGDRARRRPDGALEFLGRTDRQVKIRGIRVELDEIEAAIRGHPAVEDGAVIAVPNPTGEKDLVAYVVPRGDVRSQAPDRGAGLRHWRQVYDDVIYGGIDAPDSRPADPTLNTIGWKSSYTGRPLSVDEMREQVAQTVERILERRPRRILEIGCGTGMLLFRLAPHCERYTGLDFSTRALAFVSKELTHRPWAGRVTLLTGDALDLPSDECFDAVVLNSIVQHFPSVDYLRDVIGRAVARVDDGGFVFVGDVRSLALLRAFHASVAVARTFGALGADELDRVVTERVRDEGELILDPAFFTGAGFDRVCGVRVQLKRGRHHNELTRFRYDVVLDVGPARTDAGAADLPWDRLELRSPRGYAELARLLGAGRSPAVRVLDVPNRRVAEAGHYAIDPEDLWQLGEACGYRVAIDWTEGSPVGNFDAFFTRSVPLPSRPVRFDPAWRSQAHDPAPSFAAKELVRRVREHLRTVLPASVVPTFLVPIQNLPTTANGKIDRARLPVPEPLRKRAAGPPAQPATDTQAQLAELWREILGVGTIGPRESFFDLGGDSLKALRLIERVRGCFGVSLSPVRVFEHHTLTGMAALLRSPANEAGPQPPRPRPALAPRPGKEIAIIGMAVRVPGAQNLEAFWDNLRDGVMSISTLSEHELRDAGVDEALLADGAYVRAAPVLEDSDKFDAEFFGYSPREASFIDPQHRVLLECAWEAMEHAGYNPQACLHTVGTFAGSSLNTYLLNCGLIPMFEKEFVLTLSSNDKDFLASRISYKLALRGPAVTIQTACSTSLAAIHLACQSLRSGDCDMALAGGVCVKVPQNRGHLYRRGGLLASDGRVRAFDAKATGTVFGSGAGVVVLKRLDDALRDGDTLHALIKGSAINNDGSEKASFTAPSIGRQSDVVVQALASADVSADTVSYVEAHGTGTPIGDPIEITALTRAFRTGTSRRQFCAVGSVKTNVGHLEAAAGVVGTIKVVLALQNQIIPPTLNYDTPNPAIDFVESPFFVNSSASRWPSAAEPRRAGVNGLGVGGTNVHLILEEAPPARPKTGGQRSPQLILLSARTDRALDAIKARLTSHLVRHADVELSDIAFTLQTGRKHFAVRESFVCATTAEAVEQLSAAGGARRIAAPADLLVLCPPHSRRDWAAEIELYETEPVFRARVDVCRNWVQQAHGVPSEELLWSNSEIMSFVADHAKLDFLSSGGVRPQCLAGAGVGELVAACAAGVLSVEQALSILVGHAPCGVTPGTPTIPVYSSAVGKWLSADEFPTGEEWLKRIRTRRLPEVVIRGEGRKLACFGVSPGRSDFLLDEATDLIVTDSAGPSARHARLSALGQLWMAGVDIDWPAVHGVHQCRRVPLPTYAFERRRYWWGSS